MQEKMAEVVLSGTVRPQHVVSVSAEVEGNIEALLVDTGEEVYQGQLLARIGSADLESSRDAAAAEVERAQSEVNKNEAGVHSARLEVSRADAEAERARVQMERARQAYDRQVTLHNAGATPRIVFEKAQKEYEAASNEFEVMDKAARAARETLQLWLNRLASARTVLAQKNEELEETQSAFANMEVRSPVDGVVVARKGEVGRPVQEAGGDLFEIAVDLSTFEISVEPEPAVLQRLHGGDSATVSIGDLQNATIPATIKEIQGHRVVVEFPNVLSAVRPGMHADVRFKLD